MTVAIRAQVWHQSGVFHKNYDAILVALSRQCETFTDIGKRFGVSREHIRQIAEATNTTNGRRRITACTLNTMWTRWNALPEIVALRALGLDVRPIMGAKAQGYRRPLRHRVRVNTFTCGIKRFNIRPNGVLHLYPLKARTLPEYVLCRSGADWFVIPAKKYPRKGTEFTAKPTHPMRRANSKRHDYLSYWNAWHLLKQPREAVALSALSRPRGLDAWLPATNAGTLAR